MIYKSSKESADDTLSTPADHSEGHHDDEDDDDCCVICFAPFENGDRVGRLPCTHIFHVDCLKVWLQRKNSCPLCQTQRIATPRYDEISESTAAVSESSGAEEISVENVDTTLNETAQAAVPTTDEEANAPGTDEELVDGPTIDDQDSLVNPSEES